MKSPWQAFAFNAPLLFIFAIYIQVTADTTDSGVSYACENPVTASFLRVLLLMSFHSAPASWLRSEMRAIHSSHSKPRSSARLLALRMPIAVWTSICLVIGWTLWPVLECRHL